ncbi:hypothetical protein B0T14DRAFT_517461 [Immersiella caudata]|uniref:Uncharacterized protein n=1 Tax=Immersiella caudata TaxID=314043 RepID=A0AA39WYM9_9PEZI|nr:hypothetical protein B0T14DRAFT_517461 [Immersiella caudata]
MAPVMIFAFGPEDSFVFWCSTKLITHRACPAFATTVSARLGTPYSLTLGPGENEYAAVYLNKETNSIWRSLNYAKDTHLYGITNILFAKNDGPSHPSEERISIGGPSSDKSSQHTYIVVKGGVVYLPPSKTTPLPASLTATLDNEKRLKKPVRDVVLGHGGAWFLQYTDGTYKFDFAGRYQELEQILQSDVPDIQHLSLSRCSAEHFFLAYAGCKKVRYSMKAAFEGMIVPLIREYYASCKTVSGAVDGDTGVEAKPGELPPPYT